MNTIDYYLDMIRKDKDLQNIILKSEEIQRERVTKSRNSKKIKTGIVRDVDYFWSSVSGSEFRLMLENKYGVNTEIKSLAGKVKPAIILYLQAGGEKK